MLCSIDLYLPTFRISLSVPYSKVEQSEELRLECLIRNNNNNYYY
jgi:hypothetical protein